MNNAPTRCKGCSRSMRMIRRGMISFLFMSSMLGPLAEARIIPEPGVSDILREIESAQKKRHDKMLTQLITANDDLLSLRRTGPYLEVIIGTEKLTPVYNDMILTQRIAKIIDAVKKNLPNQQRGPDPITVSNMATPQEVKEDIRKRAKIYHDFICAQRRSLISRIPSNIDDQIACGNSIEVDQANEESDSLGPYIVMLKKTLNLTQQLNLTYISARGIFNANQDAPIWAKQMKELRKSIPQLLGQIRAIQDDNQI